MDNNNNNNNDINVDNGDDDDIDMDVDVETAAAAAAPSSRPIRYRECLKNHAVTIGGHAVDGCGEFLPFSSSPLLCAACGCHRNFHRRNDSSCLSAATTNLGGGVLPHVHHHHQYYHRTYNYSYNQHQAHSLREGPPAPPPPLALPSTSHSGGMGMSLTTDEEDMSAGGTKRKRFRTKFTPEQKERMVGLAERVGWRIQKQDEEAVQEFCNETGIKRRVFKVWMHNNKNTLGAKKLP